MRILDFLGSMIFLGWLFDLFIYWEFRALTVLCTGICIYILTRADFKEHGID